MKDTDWVFCRRRTVRRDSRNKVSGSSLYYELEHGANGMGQTAISSENRDPGCVGSIPRMRDLSRRDVHIQWGRGGPSRVNSRKGSPIVALAGTLLGVIFGTQNRRLGMVEKDMILILDLTNERLSPPTSGSRSPLTTQTQITPSS